MRKQINLFAQEGREYTRLIRTKAKLKELDLLLLGLFVISAGVIFFNFYSVNQKIQSNKAKISSLSSQIKKLDKIESYTVTITGRVAGINIILKRKSPYAGMISSLNSLFVPGLKFKNLEVSRENKLKAGGVFGSLSSLADFNERLETLKTQEGLSEAVYHLVSRKESDEYGFDLEIKK